MEFFIKIFLAAFGFINGGNNLMNVSGVDIPMVTSGDGLYERASNSYVYKGKNPNNYIVFNNELWRILSIENGSIKIMRNKSICNMAFGDSNDWNFSSLNEYLNSEYYDSLDKKYKDMVSDGVFEIDENGTVWNGRIGLMSIDEYLNSNSNKTLCGNINLYFKNEVKCYQSNYINYMEMGNNNHVVWTMTKDVGDDVVYYAGNTYFGDSNVYSDYGVLPVLYLDKNIKLLGEGTLHNPFQIEI